MSRKQVAPRSAPKVKPARKRRASTTTPAASARPVVREELIADVEQCLHSEHYLIVTARMVDGRPVMRHFTAGFPANGFDEALLFERRRFLDAITSVTPQQRAGLDQTLIASVTAAK